VVPEGLATNYTAVVIAGIVGFVGMGIMFAASYLLSPKKTDSYQGYAIRVRHTTCSLLMVTIAHEVLHIRNSVPHIRCGGRFSVPLGSGLSHQYRRGVL